MRRSYQFTEFNRLFTWCYVRRWDIVTSLVITLSLIGILLVAGCKSSEPPPVDHGTVSKVEAIKNRGPAVFVTVHYANGTNSRYRLASGTCLVGQRYPDCADDG